MYAKVGLGALVKVVVEVEGVTASSVPAALGQEGWQCSGVSRSPGCACSVIRRQGVVHQQQLCSSAHHIC